MKIKYFDWNKRDPLFEEVAHYVVETQSVNTEALQQKFSIDCDRANQIVEQLEQTYIVGKQWLEREPRQIYCCCTRNLEQKLKNYVMIARLRPLEDKWQAHSAEYNNDLDEVKDKTDSNTTDIDKEWEEISKSFRHGMSKEDWGAYKNALDYLKHERIIQECPWGGDYHYSEILEILKFKIELMIEYWEQFGHLCNGVYVVSTMRTTCRLIEIVLQKGNERRHSD